MRVDQAESPTGALDIRQSRDNPGLKRDGAEITTYFCKPIFWLLANDSPRETALVTAVGHIPISFDTATVVIPNSRTAQ
jgi:hypothetical protein